MAAISSDAIAQKYVTSEEVVARVDEIETSTSRLEEQLAYFRQAATDLALQRDQGVAFNDMPLLDLDNIDESASGSDCMDSAALFDEESGDSIDLISFTPMIPAQAADEYETLHELMSRIAAENRETVLLNELDAQDEQRDLHITSLRAAGMDESDQEENDDNDKEGKNYDLPLKYSFLHELFYQPMHKQIFVYRAVLLERRQALEKRVQRTDEYLQRYKTGRSEIKRIERQEAKERAREAHKMMRANLRRSNRLGAGASKTRSSFGDAVTDAELMDIIAQLEAAEERAERNRCSVPDMFVSQWDKLDQVFINTGNRLVTDPVAHYGESQITREWEQHEMGLFKELYIQHPKQFHVISAKLSYRTTADCIRFYYLHKYDLDLRKLSGEKGKGRKGPRNLAVRKQAINNSNSLINAIDPDKLPIAEPSPTPQTHLPRTFNALDSISPVANTTDTTISSNTCPDLELVVSVTVGSEGGSNWSASPAEGRATRLGVIPSEPKRRRVETKDRSFGSKLSEYGDNSDDEYVLDGRSNINTTAILHVSSNSSSSSNGGVALGISGNNRPSGVASGRTTSTSGPGTPKEVARWSEEDKRRGLEAFSYYGKDYRRVAELVGTKTEEQCKNFYSNNRRSIVLPDEHDRKGRSVKRKTDDGDADEMDMNQTSRTSTRDDITTPKRRRNNDRTLIIHSPLMEKLEEEDNITVTPRTARKPKREKPDSDKLTEERSRKVNSYWSKQEEQEFLVRLAEYGPQFEAIAAYIEDKSAQQVKNYWKRHRTSLGLDRYDYHATPGTSPAANVFTAGARTLVAAGSIHALLTVDDSPVSTVANTSPAHPYTYHSRFNTPQIIRSDLPVNATTTFPSASSSAGSSSNTTGTLGGHNIASFLQHRRQQQTLPTPSHIQQPPSSASAAVISGSGTADIVTNVPPGRAPLPSHYYSSHPNASPSNYPYTPTYYNQYSNYTNDYRYGFQSMPNSSSGSRPYPYTNNILPAFASIRNYQPPAYFPSASGDIGYRTPLLILPNPSAPGALSAPTTQSSAERPEPSPTTPILPPILPSSSSNMGAFSFSEPTILPSLKGFHGSSHTSRNVSQSPSTISQDMPVNSVPPVSSISVPISSASSSSLRPSPQTNHPTSSGKLVFAGVMASGPPISALNVSTNTNNGVSNKPLPNTNSQLPIRLQSQPDCPLEQELSQTPAMSTPSNSSSTSASLFSPTSLYSPTSQSPIHPYPQSHLHQQPLQQMLTTVTPVTSSYPNHLHPKPHHQPQERQPLHRLQSHPSSYTSSFPSPHSHALTQHRLYVQHQHAHHMQASHQHHQQQPYVPNYSRASTSIPKLLTNIASSPQSLLPSSSSSSIMIAIPPAPSLMINTSLPQSSNDSSSSNTPLSSLLSQQQPL